MPGSPVHATARAHRGASPSVRHACCSRPFREAHLAPKGSEPPDRRGKGILDRIVSTVSGEDRTEDRTEEAPKATDLLKSQHDDVRKLFKDYEDSGENAHATRKRLIDEAGRQLDVHAELEERVFYPACRELT